jgi:hypothetical protein
VKSAEDGEELSRGLVGKMTVENSFPWFQCLVSL